MMSVARTFRQKLPCNLKAISKFSQTAVKTPAANIHTVKLLELHDTLHAAKEPELQFRGLRIPGFPTSPATSPPRIALHIAGRVMNETPTTFCSMYTSAITSAAGAAKQSISAMISDSAQTQINRTRESHGRFQNKYLYGNPKPSPKPASCEVSNIIGCYFGFTVKSSCPASKLTFSRSPVESSQKQHQLLPRSLNSRRMSPPLYSVTKSRKLNVVCPKRT